MTLKEKNLPKRNPNPRFDRVWWLQTGICSHAARDSFWILWNPISWDRMFLAFREIFRNVPVASWCNLSPSIEW